MRQLKLWAFLALGITRLTSLCLAFVQFGFTVTRGSKFNTALQVGFDPSSTRKASLSKPKKTPKRRPAQDEVVGGSLPDDDFAQFPPLRPQLQNTLVRVDEAERKPVSEVPLPSEVLGRIREKHGFPKFESSADVFPGLRLLHADPVVLEVEHFFTPEECDSYIAKSIEPRPRQGKKVPQIGKMTPRMVESATINAQAQFQQQRTSTTWFHHYAAVPELLGKASTLLGVEDLRLWEEPQTVRYRPGEKFSWHLDALPPVETGASKGGQRTATLLVYLTDLDENFGGATAFRDLGPLRVRPRKGTALLFFPTFGGEPGCPLDLRTLHAGEAVSQQRNAKTKWIAQIWLHKKPYPPAVPRGNSHAAAEAAVADFTNVWRAKANHRS